MSPAIGSIGRLRRSSAAAAVRASRSRPPIREAVSTPSQDAGNDTPEPATGAGDQGDTSRFSRGCFVTSNQHGSSIELQVREVKSSAHWLPWVMR